MPRCAALSPSKRKYYSSIFFVSRNYINNRLCFVFIAISLISNIIFEKNNVNRLYKTVIIFYYILNVFNIFLKITICFNNLILLS